MESFSLSFPFVIRVFFCSRGPPLPFLCTLVRSRSFAKGTRAISTPVGRSPTLFLSRPTWPCRGPVYCISLVVSQLDLSQRRPPVARFPTKSMGGVAAASWFATGNEEEASNWGPAFGGLEVGPSLSPFRFLCGARCSRSSAALVFLSFTPPPFPRPVFASKMARVDQALFSLTIVRCLLTFGPFAPFPCHRSSLARAFFLAYDAVLSIVHHTVFIAGPSLQPHPSQPRPLQSTPESPTSSHSHSTPKLSVRSLKCIPFGSLRNSAPCSVGYANAMRRPSQGTRWRKRRKRSGRWC